MVHGNWLQMQQKDHMAVTWPLHGSYMAVASLKQIRSCLLKCVTNDSRNGLDIRLSYFEFHNIHLRKKYASNLIGSY